MGIGPIRKHRLDRLAKQAAAKAEAAAKEAAAKASAEPADEQSKTQPTQDKRKH